MKIFAHRGYTKKGDAENTLEAFESAIAEKMCIELDVRLTKDGVPIVFHDASLKRMTNNNLKLADINYGELKDIKMKTGEAIPSLKETLELVNGRTLLLIEIKTAKKGFTNHRL
ncbi:MAG: glycerophosphodiester phosphodiesterase, partial [Ruminococcus sp.]|nr:glycerophosphodiester phosphodiesterase [Ruminococcus sp.]